jgi:hypothetical protein
MTKKMCAVGFGIVDFDYIKFDSKKSLSDYDIIIFNPSIDSCLSRGDFISFTNGGGCYSSDIYKKLMKYCDHWKEELKNAFNRGKTIFIMLSPNEEILVNSGGVIIEGKTKKYNASKFFSYNCLPFSIDTRETNGKIIKKVKQEISEYVDQIYELFHEYIEYKVVLSNLQESAKTIFVNNDGECIGAFKQSETSGKIILYPYIDFNNDNFTTKAGYFSKKANELSMQFQKILLQIAKHSNNETVIAPEWIIRNKEYKLFSEIEKENKITENQNKINDLEIKNSKFKQDLIKEQNLKKLLYSTGKDLELAVCEALGILGMQCNEYNHPEKTLQIDCHVKYNNIVMIGEVKGKEKDINKEDIAQLCSNIHQYYALEMGFVGDKPKGILFGNSQRSIELEKRNLTFTKTCLDIAESNKIILVLTSDLFKVVLYIKNTKDIKFAQKCVEAIIQQEQGLVKFPEIPLNK